MANHKKERIDKAQGVLYFMGKKIVDARILGGELAVECDDGVVFYIVGCQDYNHFKNVFPKAHDRLYHNTNVVVESKGEQSC